MPTTCNTEQCTRNTASLRNRVSTYGLHQLPDEVFRRADEIAAQADDYVLPRLPTLSRDICLLAVARARQELQTSVLNNALSVHYIQSGKFGDIGLKGMCSFVAHLPYVCPNNVFVLPVAHMLLYGVIRDINKFIITPATAHPYVLTKDQKQLVASRTQGFYPCSDFPNQYRDIMEHMVHWKLKEWMDWCDVHVRTVMRGITIGNDPVFTELYHKLHRAALFFCKNTVGHYVKDPRGQFTAYVDMMRHHCHSLRAYATYVEAKVSKELCKNNLHLSVCRLPI